MKHRILKYDKQPYINFFIKELKKDPDIGNYNLEAHWEDEYPFIVWTNPADDQKWRESGYAEDYDGDFSNVEPLPLLAIISGYLPKDCFIEGIDPDTILKAMISKGIKEIEDLVVYKLAPEEKSYGNLIIPSTGELDESQLDKINSLGDFKEAILSSIWDE